MKTRFKRNERLASGVFFALIPAIGNFALIAATGSSVLWYYFWAYPIAGFIAGILVSPAIINPDQYLKVRSFAAGCLTLFALSLIMSLLLAIRGGIDLYIGLSLSWDDITFSFVHDWLENLLTFTGISLIASIPYCLLYSPAGMLFSYLLSRHRNRSSNINIDP